MIKWMKNANIFQTAKIQPQGVAKLSCYSTVFRKTSIFCNLINHYTNREYEHYFQVSYCSSLLVTLDLNQRKFRTSC